MEFIKDPMAIEVKSFEIIRPFIEKYNLSYEEEKVYSRIIHASGDVEYAPIIHISKDAIANMKEAILRGCKIFTDVEMVKTGINKRKLSTFGGEVICKIADPEIAKYAKDHGITRSIAAMRHFGKELEGAIVAIGNAPTALFEVIRLMKEENIRPAAIVGTPVGFVGAKESKDYLKEVSPVPFITVLGNKGGSPIAASCINAVMYLIDNERL